MEVLADGVILFPTQDKLDKWLMKIDEALRTRRLTSGEASKLSGQLQWASQCTFKRAGRAMLRPLIDQSKRKNSVVDSNLFLALSWWAEALRINIRRHSMQSVLLAL